MSWDYLSDASLGSKWAAALPTNPTYRRTTGTLGNVILTEVEPNEGSEEGEAVTIIGDNFQGVHLVTFGGKPATDVVLVDAQHITCTTPAGTSGQTVAARVVCAGRPVAKLENAFTYTDA
jgi:hypothetical protein